MTKRTYMRIDHTTKASIVTDKVAPKILLDASSAGFEGNGGIPVEAAPPSTADMLGGGGSVVMGRVRVVEC